MAGHKWFWVVLQVVLAVSASLQTETEVYRRADYAAGLVHSAIRGNERLLSFLQRLRRSDRRQRQIWLLLGCIHTQQQFLARFPGIRNPDQIIGFGLQHWRLLTVVNY